MPRTLFGLLSITISFGLIIGLWWHVNQSPPLQQEWHERDATLLFEASPRQVLFSGDCYTLSWQTENINGIYLNYSSTVGAGEEKACGNSVFTVDFRDGTSEEYLIPSTPFFANPDHWWIFWAISLGLAIGSVSLLHLPSQWGQDWQDWKRDLRGTVQSFSLPEALQLGLLILLSAIIFLRGAWTESVGYDESVTLLLARHHLGLVVSDYQYPNNHVFVTALAHLSNLFFGFHTFTLRLPIVILTIMSVPAAYWVGRRYAHPMVGLLFAVLVMSHPLLYYYGTMVRGYAVQTFLILWVIGLLPYVSRHTNQVAWLCYAILVALAFFTIPTSVYPVTAISLFLGITIWLNNTGVVRWQILKTWVLFTVLAGWLTIVLYSPILVHWGISALTNNAYVAPIDRATLISLLPNFVTDLFRYLLPIPVIPYTFALGLSLLGLWAQRRHPARFSLLFVLVLLTPIGWTLLLRPNLIGFERVFIYLIPFLVLAVAVGLGWFAARYHVLRYVYPVITWAFIGIWVLQSLLTPIPQDETARSVQYLKPLMQPNAYIVVRQHERWMYHFYEQGMADPYRLLYSPEIPLTDVDQLYFIIGDSPGHTYEDLLLWLFETQPSFIPHLLYEAPSKQHQIWSVDPSEK